MRTVPTPRPWQVKIITITLCLTTLNACMPTHSPELTPMLATQPSPQNVTGAPTLPPGILGIRPAPGSIISSREYEEEQLPSGVQNVFLGDLKGRVCVSIPRMLEQAGQKDVTLQMLDQMLVLLLDGNSPATGSVATDFRRVSRCLRVHLTPGVHRATVEIHEPADAMTYTWSFTITEDTP